MSKISLKLLIDKEKKKVVFAEAKSDFVDVLFSFLTLPLGSIVKLLGKQSGLGSLDSLYESFEQLDSKFLQTEACREMLLNPRSAASAMCESLKIKNIHYPNPWDVYFCNEIDCCVQSIFYYTYINKSPCGRCGKQMDGKWGCSEPTDDMGGVFVNERSNFIITDNLRVIPASLMSGISLLKELQIRNADILEERAVEVGTKEALNLLKSALVTQHALTEAFFPDDCLKCSVNCFTTFKEEEIDESEIEQQINVKIILNKKNNNVLYIEVGGDFVNQLLSFLTFPLGSVFKLLDDHISSGCVSNLYSSAKSLSLEYFISEKCKNMLVSPQLASHYGLPNQMLKLDEMTSEEWTCSMSCVKCWKDNGFKSCLTAPCLHGLSRAELIEQNPKLEEEGNDFGGGFVDDYQWFMVADNLRISAVSVISAITGIDDLFLNLVEREVRVDKVKVLSLLGTMLISKTVLSDVFFPKPTLQ